MTEPESKAERKAMRRAAEDAEQRAQALATPRHIDEDLHYRGIGELLLRLAYRPSFEPTVVWEVRILDGVLSAHVSRGTEPDSPYVLGFEALAVDDSSLRAVLDQLSLAALPLTPAVTIAAGADGATYTATIGVGFTTQIRFSWREGGAPDNWSSVVETLLAARRLFEGEAGSSGKAKPTPVHVVSGTSTVELVRLSNGEFQVWQAGVFGSLICGTDFILAVDTLAAALKRECAADISVLPATIVRKSTGEAWTSYSEIVPLAELRGPQDLPAARLSAQRAWRFRQGHLFVSAAVHKALVALELPSAADLTFSVGFSHFGGLGEY